MGVWNNGSAAVGSVGIAEPWLEECHTAHTKKSHTRMVHFVDACDGKHEKKSTFFYGWEF